MDRDGQGALHYAPDSEWGVDKGSVGTGETWSAGGVTLCKKSGDVEVRLRDVEAVSVDGEVRLDNIGARTTHYADPEGPSDPNTHLVGTYPGIPDGLQAPAGFVVTTTCPSSKAPVGEIVVTLTKTGDEGGNLDGLRITYSADGELHELVYGFHFGLCGTGPSADPCQ